MPYCDGNCEINCSGQTICPLFFDDEDYRYDDPDYVDFKYYKDMEED